MSYLQANLQKITQLTPEAQYAAALWLNDLESQKMIVQVTEAYRPQARQEELYKIGRRGIPNESPVTWTRTSYHTQRLACDVIGYKCSYDQIAKVAAVYGIYRPKELVLLGDLGHFQFDQCIREPKVPNYTPSALARRLQRIVKVTTDALMKNSALRGLKRLWLDDPSVSVWKK